MYGYRPLKPFNSPLLLIYWDRLSKGYRSARIGEDFEPVAPFDLVIPAGDNRSNIHRFTLKVVKGKENETLAITATSPDLPPDHCPFPAYNPPSPRVNCFYTIPEVIFTIEELGGPPQQQQGEREVILSVIPVSLDERDGPTEVTVTATHEGTPPDSPATVTLSPSGTAAPGADYYAVITGATVTIQANEPSATTKILITPVRDEVVEDNETIQISGASEGYTVTPASVTLVDANPPTVTFESDRYTAREDGDPVEVRVILGQPADEGLIIPITVTPHEDTEASDYKVNGVDGLTNVDLTISEGATESNLSRSHRCHHQRPRRRHNLRPRRHPSQRLHRRRSQPPRRILARHQCSTKGMSLDATFRRTRLQDNPWAIRLQLGTPTADSSHTLWSGPTRYFLASTPTPARLVLPRLWTSKAPRTPTKTTTTGSPSMFGIQGAPSTSPR